MVGNRHEEATRTAYDLVAEDYANLLNGALAASTWDRMVLAGFAELVQASGPGLVADVGCGPGRITRHLHDLGIDASGFDLSPAMVNVAQRTYPELRFQVGSMMRLGFDDGELAGVVAWYSVIHTPTEEHPALFLELARMLRPGGHLVLAFQVGDEVVHLDNAYGHGVCLDAYRLSPTAISDQLESAGFETVATLVRKPVEPEQQSQAYVIARTVERSAD